MKVSNKTILFLIISMVAGCSTPGPILSEQADRVRISSQTPVGCKYISRITGKWNGTYWTATEAIGNAQVSMMNKAAEAGANTIEILSGGLSGFGGIDGAYSTGEAYFCNQ